jgi:hypothetical protein
MSRKIFHRTFWFTLAAMTAAVLTLNLLAAHAQNPGRVLEPVRTPPRILPDSPWRALAPIAYENLTLFPVVARVTQDTSAFVTLDEALMSGDVVVAERGSLLVRGAHSGGASVNQLVLVNRGKRPVVLLAGEVLTGGKQDRVIGKDRIVAPGAEPLPLDVFCVERGRWSGTRAGFSESKVIAHPSVREKAAVDKAQDQVWGAVRGGTTAQAPASAEPPVAEARLSRDALNTVVTREAQSESYAKIYRSRSVTASVEQFSEEIARRFRNATAGLKGEQVVGVVIAYGGGVAWSDLFASNALFESYWPKLLRSYVVEAIARPHYRERATVADAQAFLAPLDGRETVESEPGVYRWREIAAGHYAQIDLESLLGRSFTLHRVRIHRTS